MSKHNWWKSGVFMLGGLFLGHLFGHYLLADVEPEPTCETMAEELWAFQQCLKYQPACRIKGGEASFANHHRTRIRFEEQCGADRGDAFLSQ